jgi:hypothetical protein
VSCRFIGEVARKATLNSKHVASTNSQDETASAAKASNAAAASIGAPGTKGWARSAVAKLSEWKHSRTAAEASASAAAAAGAAAATAREQPHISVRLDVNEGGYVRVDLALVDYTHQHTATGIRDVVVKARSVVAHVLRPCQHSSSPNAGSEPALLSDADVKAAVKAPPAAAQQAQGAEAGAFKGGKRALLSAAGSRWCLRPFACCSRPCVVV